MSPTSSKKAAATGKTKASATQEIDHTPAPPEEIPTTFPGRTIHISGARCHNLKNVSCHIPHGQLTVFSGISGSGKSSLAFDTLYAEGQRRYLESLSSYARQFLDRIEKPDVERIEHILPAIALEQKNAVKNARSTVGTATDAYDYLRILYAALGTLHCETCEIPVQKTDPRAIVDRLQALDEGTRLLIVAPVDLTRVSLKELQDKGFFRAITETGEAVDWTQGVSFADNTLSEENQSLIRGERLPVLIDRLAIRQREGESARILEAVENGWAIGHPPSDAWVEVGQTPPGGLWVLRLNTDKTVEEVLSFAPGFRCPSCQTAYPEPSADWFSFNNAVGACTDCEGFGRVMGLDMDKVIPNKSRTLEDDAIHPFSTPANEEIRNALIYEAAKTGVRTDVPFETLTEDERHFVMTGGGSYPGVRGFFDWLETKRYKVHVRVTLARYRGYYPCPTCQGSRLKPIALQVTLGGNPSEESEGSTRPGLNINDLCQQTVSDFLPWMEAWSARMDKKQEAIAHRPLKELMSRLRYLHNVGLGYLTLSRQTRTLSGGEAQRIHLASALGSALTGTLYVLDEPTVGLHARDTTQLLGILQALRDQGNTVVVVEHDREMIEGADHIIDMGPGGGDEGGRIVYTGTVADLYKANYSLTGKYLKQLSPEAWQKKTSSHFSHEQTRLNVSAGDTPRKNKRFSVIGARGNNLKDLTVHFPKNQLIAVTGVSGSGKSTLIRHTLYAQYRRKHGDVPDDNIGACDAVEGLDVFHDVILVDQSPPARSARSNPATFVKAYDEIRQVFAKTNKAKIMGIAPGAFSFNTSGGRCETCEGLGFVTIDMQFMADVTMECTDCRGKRFQPSVLSIELAGKNIDDVLNMTVDEAIHFFHQMPKVKSKLKPLQDIGLGYLKLGQQMSTLSGGEAQRMKLASYLKFDVPSNSEILFLFDEPTTGLHMANIDILVQVFRRLVSAGHSLVVIEHNTDFIAQCDYIVDMGPEGGDGGGKVVVQGPIDAVMDCPESITGQYLAQILRN